MIYVELTIEEAKALLDRLCPVKYERVREKIERGLARLVCQQCYTPVMECAACISGSPAVHQRVCESCFKSAKGK